MQTGPDEELLLIEGGRSVRCRRINYLDDQLCRGLADPNPMHAPPASGHRARGPATSAAARAFMIVTCASGSGWPTGRPPPGRGQ